MKMQKQIGKWLNNEDGATSVLIIFMMIVLVALGVFAITSADVNIKLSKKAAGWSEKFYALESMGSQYVGEVDAALATAEAEAKLAVEAQSFTAVLAVEARLFVVTEEVAAAFGAAYMQRAYEELDAVNARYPESQMVVDEDGHVEITVLFCHEADTDFQFRVTLAVQVPAYEYVVADGAVQMERIVGRARYAVVDWYQEQKEKVYDTYELWDGTMDGNN